MDEIILKQRRAPSLGYLRDESGIALIAALLLMIFLTFLGTTIVILSSSNIKVSNNTERSSQAFMVAEAGVAEAIVQLRADSDWGPEGGNGAANANWAPTGTVQLLKGQVGTYNIDIFDRDGSLGRRDDDTLDHTYTSLNAGDALVEVIGKVGGFERKVSVVIRAKIEAFTNALTSTGTINADATGKGGGAGNHGKINGKQYAQDSISWYGNYDLSQSEASSIGKISSPNCSTAPAGTWKSCKEDIANPVEAPQLDFSYYQDQNNFNVTDPINFVKAQQVFIMTPTVNDNNGKVGDTALCTNPNCNDTWTIQFAITTDKNNYTLISRVETQIVAGNNWQHTIFYCPVPNPGSPWDGVGTTCSDGITPLDSFTFISDNQENSKPFIDAYQFNAYTTPTRQIYGSQDIPPRGSIVNVIDATNHLEFLGPPAGESVTVYSTILIGTATDNSMPAGKIDFEGGAGYLNFVPTNGLAVVAETVKFVAKYSEINITVGQADQGALIIARCELKIEGEKGNGGNADFNANVNLNGSAVVGNNATGKECTNGKGKSKTPTIKIEDYTQFNANYVELKQNIPGLTDIGSNTIELGEWREL